MARGRSGQDQRCAGLGCGLPQICFLTPSAVSADPVDPPFVTLPILTNEQLSVPANVFESSRLKNHGAGTRHDFPSLYPSLTIHTALFSCPKRPDLPQRSHHRLSFSLSTPPYFHNSLEDCVLVYLLFSRNRCVYPMCAITTAHMNCVVCNGLSVQTCECKVCMYTLCEACSVILRVYSPCA